ncbi:unknown; predicted coding region [Mycoplasmopsis pulmonis]|uniref:Uncharacterized protein n=1 Tax=Mycoplasmopsis pulmonis (strain UAB CTIP) TaxID=272635 RepID=Q98RF0_MYCPU|nr:hypothetical protein [Mycoplasmopsis pulmonis]CAC13232.1 unknown; predicted coding region [Mycoplasmopsis pulmonis]VEU67850.1 Uncharacterised protein [Mycoplasmopsis pulmonis]
MKSILFLNLLGLVSPVSPIQESSQVAIHENNVNSPQLNQEVREEFAKNLNEKNYLFELINYLTIEEQKKFKIDYVINSQKLKNFSFDDFNSFFETKIFENEEEKNIYFDEYLKNDFIYQKFYNEVKDQLPKKRGRRAILSSRQRETLSDWIKTLIEKLESYKTSLDNATFGTQIAKNVGTVVSTISEFTSVPIWSLVFLAIGSLTEFISTIVHIGYESYYSESIEELPSIINELSNYFRTISSIDDDSYEDFYLSKIKELITKANKLVGGILKIEEIDKNRLDIEEKGQRYFSRYWYGY